MTVVLLVWVVSSYGVSNLTAVDFGTMEACQAAAAVVLKMAEGEGGWPARKATAQCVQKNRVQ